MPRRQEDLTRPRQGFSIGIHYDPDAFGRLSEGIARVLGTARFLVAQTIFVIAWITLNVVSVTLRWDAYPFILLNLAFSTQAAYAAPLILLAQNRQDDRDRAQSEADREVNARTQADTEYVARELAAVRIGLSNVVTNDDLKTAVDRVTRAMDQLVERLARLEPGAATITTGDAGPGGSEPPKSDLTRR